jgi:tetratricopeptide (TPR) repeat protein
MTKGSFLLRAARGARVPLAALLLVGCPLGFLYRYVNSPPNYWPAVSKGQTELVRNRPYQALREVAGVSHQGYGAGEAMTVAAQAFIRLDQRDDARRALERALQLQPNQPLAFRLLAAIHIAAGDTDRGLADLAEAARLAPEDSRPWRVMGKVFFSRKEYDKSIHAYQESLRRNPDDQLARIGCLTVLLD